MSIFLWSAQKAIYARLSSELTCNIFDNPPQQPEGMPQDSFPYVAIGEDIGYDWSTDDTLGGYVDVVLHIWSRKKSKKETKVIMEGIYTALNRQAAQLSASGYRFVDCLSTYTTILDDPDGVTRHGICRYRVTMEKE